jgi:MFS family permease
LLTNIRVILFCLSLLIFNISDMSTVIFLPAQATTQGLSAMHAAYVLAISGIADTLGRMGSGPLLELGAVRKCRPVVYTCVVFAHGTLLFAVPALHTFMGFVVFTSVHGLLTGALVAHKSIILVDILGTQQLPGSFGMLMLFQGIGALIGPPFAGNVQQFY